MIRMISKKTFYWICLIVVILEIVFLKIMHLGHPYFDFEELPALGAILGFLGTLFIVVVAKSLSLFITKREYYYE